MHADDHYESQRLPPTHRHRWVRVQEGRWQCMDYPRCLAHVAAIGNELSPEAYTPDQYRAILRGVPWSDVFPIPRLPAGWRK